jgi:BON domain
MPIDPDLTNVVRDALSSADTVDARSIDVVAEDDVLVLRGGVASHEEASAAVSVADQLADEVRNELRIDPNLREGLDQSEPRRERNASDAEPSPFDPTTEPDDVVDDLQHSLTENVPWDPPDEAVQVPTRAEERGLAGSGGFDEDPDAPGAEAGKSLPDLSPEELSRAAHPQPRDEENA